MLPLTMPTVTEQAETYDGSIPLDNAQHELLCHQYLIDFNGQQAGERSGYSPKTAYASVSRVLSNAKVQARLAYLKEQRLARARMTGDDVLKELECIAKSRLGNIVHFNESGASFVHSPETLPDDDHAAIQSIEVKEDHYGNPEKGSGVILTTKVKMYDKLGALKELAKHHNVCQPKSGILINGESLPEGIVINFVSAKGKE